jgi:hypothetical protein
VRRIPDLFKSTVDGQGELFTVWRSHAAFTDSPYVLVQAEAQHRGHAIIEQVFAELIDGPLAHLPSGRFNANNAWFTCIAIAHNLTRAATIRRHLINVFPGVRVQITGGHTAGHTQYVITGAEPG